MYQVDTPSYTDFDRDGIAIRIMVFIWTQLLLIKFLDRSWCYKMVHIGNFVNATLELHINII